MLHKVICSCFSAFLFIAVIHAQELYLNAGTLHNKAMIAGDNRILIDFADDISFWDIDRSVLLKRIGAGNQFVGGVTQTMQPLQLSADGHWLACVKGDSLVIIDVNWQEVVFSFGSSEPVAFSDLFCAFSASGSTFVMIKERCCTTREVYVYDTRSWKRKPTRQLEKLLQPVISSSPTVVGNDLYIATDSAGVILKMDLDEPNPVTTPWQPPLPASFFSIHEWNIIACAGQRLLLYQRNAIDITSIALVDVARHQLLDTASIPFEVQVAHNDGSGWVVMRPYEPSQKGAGEGLPIFVCNTIQKTHYLTSLDRVRKDSTGNYHFSADNFSLRNGCFIFRNETHGTIDLIQLDNNSKLSVTGRMNVDWIFTCKDGLIYRSYEDKKAGVYRWLRFKNNERGMMRPGGWLMNIFSSADPRFAAILVKDNGDYQLGTLSLQKGFVPEKLLRMKPVSLVPRPIARNGEQYLFRLETVNSNTSETEFIEDIGNSEVFTGVFDQAPLQYLLYHPTTNGSSITRQPFRIEDMAKREGFFRLTYAKSAYGFDVPDSLTIYKNNGKIFGFTTGEQIQQFFGYSAASLQELASQLIFHLNGREAIFHLNGVLYRVIALDGKIASVDKVDLSQLTSGSGVYDAKISWCNQQQTIACAFTGGGNKKILFLDSNFRRVQEYSSEMYGTSSYVSTSGLQVLTVNSNTKEVTLTNLQTHQEYKWPWQNKTFLFNEVAAGFNETGQLCYSYEHTGHLNVYRAADGKRMFTDSLPNIQPVALIGDKLLYISRSGIPYLREGKSRYRRFTSGGYTSFPVACTFVSDSTLITTGSNYAAMWNTRQCSLERLLLLPDTTSLLVTDTTGYYTTARTNLNDIVYRMNGNTSPVAEYDVLLNRPSHFIQTENIGLKNYSAALEAAYQKRLQRNKAVITSLNRRSKQSCTIANANDLTYLQGGNTVKLQVYSRGQQTLIAAVHVLVNDVPVFGRNGQGLRWNAEIDTVLNISLSAGVNRLLVYTTDTAGTASNMVPLFIEHTGAAAKPQTIFVGIGVNTYKDKLYNLHYSTKDVKDMASALRGKYGDALTSILLTDEEVTKESVIALKQRLLNTAPDDRVIVCFSGHGLLSRSFDYYLGTYDVDFDNPATKGLPYELFEGILDSIPARKKLLLIDACHSGEVDKDDLAFSNTQADSMHLKKGINIPLPPAREKIGLANSFLLMQDLFANVSRTTGAVVISAASGGQYALENAELENGVFTYSILQLLRSQEHINISALKKMVTQQVLQLTGGLQQPTFRSENRESDWMVW